MASTRTRKSKHGIVLENERLEVVSQVCACYHGAPFEVVADESLGTLFTFDDNHDAFVHNWFYFKEAYSHRLVEKFLQEFEPVRNDVRGGWVVDPFSGVGTTVLAAATLGYKSVGAEVNPFLTWVANTKLAWPKVDVSSAQRAALRVILEFETEELGEEDKPALSTFHDDRFFDQRVLETLLKLRRAIKRVAEELDVVDEGTRGAVRGFLTLGLLEILGNGTRLIKKGRGLKLRGKTYEVPTPIELAERLHRWWLSHLDLIAKNRDRYKRTRLDKAHVWNEQAFNPTHIKDHSAWISISSPPYCNSFDYSEVYKLELFFSQKVTSYEQWRLLRRRTIRSHPAIKFDRPFYHDLSSLPSAVGILTRYLSSVREATWADFGKVIYGYFDDMALTIREQARYLKPGGVSVIVVGNSSYLGIPVATDLLLAEIAEDTGYFSVESIRQGRLILTASQQWDQYKYKDNKEVRDLLRESAIILRRNDEPFSRHPRFRVDPQSS